MPRTLILMRHAKAEHHNTDGDKARELTQRGWGDAARAGVEIARFGVQHALVSTATRCRQTYQGLRLSTPAEYMDALYDCSRHTLVQRIGEITDDVQTLLVVAHSPAIPALSSELAWATRRAEDSHADVDAISCSFPTASWMGFTFDGTWAELAVEILDRGPLAPGALGIREAGGTAVTQAC